MFADYIKMGAKAVALGIGVALIIGFLANFTIQNPYIGFVSTYINKVYTIGGHYFGADIFQLCWRLGALLLTLRLSFFGVKLGLIAVRWVLKVNE